MPDRKACALPWCTAPHDHDNERTRYHHASIDHQTIGNMLVSVVAVWAERLDGRRGVEPHVAVIADGSPDPLRSDFTPREAGTFAAMLTLAGGPAWLAEALTRGAELLAPHDGQEHDGEPHRVADDAPAKLAAARRAGADRFNMRLVIDVFDVLERHGYRKASDVAGGRAAGVLADLVEAYEGGQR